MYQCEDCKCQVPAGTSAIRIVVETRSKVYPPRFKTVFTGQIPNRKQNLKTIDKGGRGTETVREKVICPACCKAREPEIPLTEVDRF